MKLRLPNKLVAAIMAAASPVLFQTLSTATVGAAAVAAVAAVSGQQAVATDLYTQPAFGGTIYTWTGGSETAPTNFQEGANWSGGSVPGRSGGKGPVYVFDGKSVTLTNCKTNLDTSDSGGVKVLNGANVSGLSLGQWAGAVYVDANSVLSATYSTQLKNTEANTAANVYVDGTFTLTNTGALNINDGNNWQNWYIGEQGMINLAGITSVNKGTKTWNMQLKLSATDTAHDVATLQNRTASENATIYKVFMTTGADLYNDVSSWSVFRANGEGATELAATDYTIWHNNACMAVSYTGSGVEKMDLTWAGGSADWTDSGTNWTASDTTTSFVNGDNVTFTGTGNTATVKGFVAAGTVTLADSAAVVLDVTTTSAGLAVEHFSVGEGSALTMKPKADSSKAVAEKKYAYQYGDVTFTAASSATAPARLVVDTLASLNFDGGLHFAQENSYATVQTNADRNQFINGLYGTNATLNLVRSSGASGGANSGRAGYFFVENLSADSFIGTINLKTDVYDSNREGLGGLIVYNSPTGLANTYVNFESGNGSSYLAFIRELADANWDGTTQAGWTRRLLGAASGKSFQDASVGGLGGTKGKVYAGSLTINAAASADYTYGGALDIKSLTKTGAGTQTISTALNLTGPIAVQEGTLKLTGGATLNSPISNAGTLALGGTVNVAFDDTQATTQYIDLDGSYTGNGYKETISGGYHVVVGNGTTDILAGAAWQINGTAAEGYTFEGGYLKGEGFSTSTDNTVYYMQVAGSTHAYDPTADTTTTSFVLNGENSTLQLSGEVPERLTSISVNGTTANVNLAEGALLKASVLSTANDGTAKLTGSGTLSLSALTLPTGVSVADTAWTGTVRVRTDLAERNAELVAQINNLANTGSKVELNGVGGWLGNNISRAVVLTGTADNGTGTALKINNGISNNIRWFTGTVSGTGDVEFAWVETTSQGTKFTGNVEGWTGLFKTTGNSTMSEDQGNLTLEFSNSATLINAGISHDRNRDLTVTFTNDNAVTMNGDISKGTNGRNLNLVAAAPVTFTGNVAANQLTINNGKTATFNAAGGKTQSIEKLAGSGALKVESTAATETAAATGGLLHITGAKENYTGAVTLSNVLTADVVGIVAENSEALSGSVIYFTSGSTWSDTTYKASLLAFRDAEGNAIDGTVAGLQGNRGHVIAKTLTIDIASGTKTFQHRYDNNRTNDSAVLTVDKLVKTGAGTQEIGGEYTEDRGFADGLVIANGIDVLAGTLHMKTRGTVKANISVAAGATFKTSDSSVMTTTATDDNTMHYNGTLTLNGTADSTATLHYADGSTYIENGLAVNGYGKVVMVWDKTQFIGGFKSVGDTPSVLTLERNSQDASQNKHPRYIVVDKSGNFNGTIKLNYKAASAESGDSFGIVAAGAEAQNALAGAVIDFTDTTSNALVAFVTTTSTNRPNTSTRIDDFATYKGDYLTSSNLRNGVVAGLKGAKGDVYAAELTINTADEKSYTYGGSLNVSSLVKDGAGEQIINGDLNAFTGIVKANGGRVELKNGAETPGTVALSGIFVNSGVLELNGGQYTVGGSANTNGVFADDKAVQNGALVLNNGASLAVDASADWWHFQVNSGSEGGIYIKGKSEGESGTASVLTATLNDGGEVAIKALNTASETGAHVIVNTGNGNNFAVNQGYITIKDADYTVNYGETAKSVNNKLQDTAITNSGTGTLTVDNGANTLVGVHAKNGDAVVAKTNSSAGTLKSIKAEGGDVTLQNLTAQTGLSLKELVIADSKTVAALTDGSTAVNAQESNVAAISIAADGKLTAGVGATLNANLTMQSGSTTSMANNSSLNMGCALTLNKGMNLDSTDGTADSMSTLESVLATGYDTRWLYTAVDSLTLVDFNGSGNDFVLTDANIDTFNGIDASTYFNNLTSGVYFLTAVANKQQGGWDIGITAPEPTTTTLSLLALAGLAARRKRK